MKKTSSLRRLISGLITGLVVTSMALTGAGTAVGSAPAPRTASSAPATTPAPAKKSTKKPSTTGSQADQATRACKPTKGRFSCFALSGTNTVESKKLAPDTTPAGYGPSDIQSAYDLPDPTSAPTVAIVDAFDDPNAESDLAVYRAQFGLPACTTANGCFRKVAQDGSTNYPATPPAGDDWAGETTLDLDAVSAACPACHILLVEADDDEIASKNLLKSVDTARTLGAKYISMSWGSSEDGTENSSDSTYFDHSGVVFTASSGDDGYSAGPIYPSTSKYVTSVGGTVLSRAPGTSRGWSESAWDGAGSGCSSTEAKPAWQSTISACSTRADTDVSADAGSAVATYDTASGHGGWGTTWGTSLSSPLIAAMYALAGTPVPGTFPVTYPYDDPSRASDINDITSGSNGGCSPSALCTGGTGWDGPTGLGTPHGVAAFTTGPHGDIKGEVTDSGTGKPVSGVTVSADDGRYAATTDTSGDYDLTVPTGSYDLTTAKYGYQQKSVTGITVTTDTSVTENLTLTAEPTHTVSGYVTDGSGHHWPMRAKITIDGYPNGPIYSNPYTGHYSVSLPAGSSYTLHVASADLPGYTGRDATVKLTDSDVTQDVALKVDATACTAPGYAFKDVGSTEAFTGWSGKDAEDGWTITDAVGNGQTWDFDNPGSWLTPPGGDSDFANVDSEDYGQGGKQDTSLVSPVVDLTGINDPEIGLDSRYVYFPGQTGSIDLSLDGGTTWTTVDTPNDSQRIDVPIPQAAGKSDVRVRFHFTGSWGRSWNIDNVLIGSRTCAPQHGGLVAGIVHDANTGAVLDGATVTSGSDASAAGTTIATPGDAGLSDGYYWLFSPDTGKTAFTVTDGRYTSKKISVDVPADSVRHKNVKLDAGHLTVAEQSLSTSEVLGRSTSKTVTFGNDGTASVHVSLSGTDAGYTAMGVHQKSTTASGAPVSVLRAKTSRGAQPGTATTASTGKAHAAATAATSAWTSVADYPEPIMDNASASHDGKVYSVGGDDAGYKLQDAYVYDPGTQAWGAIAPLPEALEAPSAAFLGDTLYVVGGWNNHQATSTHTYAYDPGKDTWTRMADLPVGVAAAGSAVVDGKLYVIGGCTQDSACTQTAAVYAYDPGSNSWSAQPNYPTAVAFIACGGVDAKVVCAGGSGRTTLTSTYAYAPGSDGWSRKADLPVDAWGAAAATANGRLEVIGGAINDGATVTNQGFAYDPSTDSWSDLPNSNVAGYRGAATCGIYKIGGDSPYGVSAATENLPGYDQCAGGVNWMSSDTTSFDVAPGQTVSVRVTMDSSVLSQPGTYDAHLVVETDSPYGAAQPVDVTLHVKPPKSWGKVTGTVTDGSGTPVSGATVAICTMYDTGTGMCGPTTYTLKTDRLGDYQLWLDKGYDPLQIIAAKDGYTPQMKIVRIRKGATSTVDFALAKNSAFDLRKTQQYLTTHQHRTTAR